MMRLNGERKRPRNSMEAAVDARTASLGRRRQYGCRRALVRHAQRDNSESQCDVSESHSIRMIDVTVCKGDDDRDRRKSTFYPGEY